ncbi:MULTISPECIES: hypothetical protein [unclassified Nostoc]|uniref:hypothetical protein n=1 Tax=unclassified Nostoc TaxID=2593658 RepID=UPI002AD28715|nr:hypothetical protein [Nostoc sp. DedQUE03]MDZ7974970.1 hypothetical protein [Nostoc sp. DedQUE03]MDZ8048660.1 hypothetical protein [Nostoc sp. DedQUE02]
MPQNFLISVEEKEKIFHTELVKYGVEYEQARKAAQILASSQPDELLSQQDRQIVTQVCNKWSAERKRYKRITSVVDS